MFVEGPGTVVVVDPTVCAAIKPVPKAADGVVPMVGMLVGGV